MAIIFSRDFDNAADTNSTSSVPTGWDAWGSEGSSATYGGVTHNAGEIITPGRGGTGKALRIWKADGVLEGYCGCLYYGQDNNFNPTSQNFYVRWTMRISADYTADYTNAGANYQKLWRLNMNGGAGELYMNCNTPYTDQTMPDGAALLIQPFLHTDPVLGYQTTSYCVLPPADMAPLFDGQWHCYELHIDSNNDTVEFWVDGELKHQNTNLSMSAQSPQWIQHFGLGNRATDVDLQNSWQYWDFDDLVIADEYVGPPDAGPLAGPANVRWRPA